MAIKEGTKEELKKANSELERRLSELRSDVYNFKSKNERLEEELEDREDRINKLTNQIHFLAWMLHKEWVSLEGIRGLNVVIQPKEEPQYWPSITDCYTRCNTNRLSN